MLKGRGKIVYSVLALLVIFLGIFLAWPIYFSVKTQATADAAALIPKGSEAVVIPATNGLREVSIRMGKGTLEFRTGSTNGVVFYPGAFVDPRSYAVILTGLAQRGVDVILVPMPLGLAPLSPERALAVIASRPDIKQWVLAGHSAGGAAAMECAVRHGSKLVGAFCWASPAEPSWTYLKVPGFGVWSTEDAWLKDKSTPAWVEGHTAPNFKSVFLEGGNHGQFAHLGSMPRDNVARISREQQVAVTVTNTSRYLMAVFHAQTN